MSTTDVTPSYWKNSKTLKLLDCVHLKLPQISRNNAKNFVFINSYSDLMSLDSGTYILKSLMKISYQILIMSTQGFYEKNNSIIQYVLKNRNQML